MAPELVALGCAQLLLIDGDQRVVDALGLALQGHHDTIGRVPVGAAQHGQRRGGDPSHPVRPVLDFPQHVGRHLVAGVALESGHDLRRFQTLADRLDD